jgi:hypothetical protein
MAGRRKADLRTITEIIEATGKRLGYDTRLRQKGLVWEEGGQLVLAFTVIASGLVGAAMADNPYPPQQSILVIPGGRAGLIAYKALRDPALAKRMMDYRLAKFRLWRTLAEMPVLTRETVSEQLASDPIERANGQMMMF